MQTGATRFALVTMWLAAPWRFLSRLVLSFALAFARRQPRRLLALVVVAGVAVAIVQAVQQHHWMTAVVLGGVATSAVLCPLADAAVSRRSEYAADRYAAGLGLGPHLALGLEALNGGRGRRASWSTRLVSRHPDVASRIDRLAAPRDRTRAAPCAAVRGVADRAELAAAVHQRVNADSPVRLQRDQSGEVERASPAGGPSPSSPSTTASWSATASGHQRALTLQGGERTSFAATRGDDPRAQSLRR